MDENYLIPETAIIVLDIDDLVTENVVAVVKKANIKDLGNIVEHESVYLISE